MTRHGSRHQGGPPRPYGEDRNRMSDAEESMADRGDSFGRQHPGSMHSMDPFIEDEYSDSDGPRSDYDGPHYDYGGLPSDYGGPPKGVSRGTDPSGRHFKDWIKTINPVTGEPLAGGRGMSRHEGHDLAPPRRTQPKMREDMRALVHEDDEDGEVFSPGAVRHGLMKEEDKARRGFEQHQRGKASHGMRNPTESMYPDPRHGHAGGRGAPKHHGGHHESGTISHGRMGRPTGRAHVEDYDEEEESDYQPRESRYARRMSSGGHGRYPDPW